VPTFDDYRYRGPQFDGLCLYDYASLVYKKPAITTGVPFDGPHPQLRSYSQFLREGTPHVPNLIGRLLFVKLNEEDGEKREDLFRMLVGLFLPWKREGIHKPAGIKWEEYFEEKRNDIPLRLQRCIENLALLHKTAKEVQQDILQREANGTRVNNQFDGDLREELDNSFVDGWVVEPRDYELDDLRLPVSRNKQTEDVMGKFGELRGRDEQELECPPLFCDLHPLEVFHEAEDDESDEARMFSGISLFN
jgi:hypothetical protein